MSLNQQIEDQQLLLHLLWDAGGSLADVAIVLFLPPGLILEAGTVKT